MKDAMSISIPVYRSGSIHGIPGSNSVFGTWYACSDGSDVYFHNPKDEEGFGGRMCEFTLMDGSKETVKGVWRSNWDAYYRDQPYSSITVALRMQQEPVRESIYGAGGPLGGVKVGI